MQEVKIIIIFLLILDLEDSQQRREPSDQLWSTYLLALDLATALEWGLLCWRPRLRSYRSWRNIPLSGHPTLRYINKFLYLSLKVCTKSSRSCTLYMTLYCGCTCMDASSHQLRCIYIQHNNNYYTNILQVPLKLTLGFTLTPLNGAVYLKVVSRT